LNIPAVQIAPACNPIAMRIERFCATVASGLRHAVAYHHLIGHRRKRNSGAVMPLAKWALTFGQEVPKAAGNVVIASFPAAADQIRRAARSVRKNRDGAGA
jgi:hypothetical protein